MGIGTRLDQIFFGVIPDKLVKQVDDFQDRWNERQIGITEYRAEHVPGRGGLMIFNTAAGEQEEVHTFRTVRRNDGFGNLMSRLGSLFYQTYQVDSDLQGLYRTEHNVMRPYMTRFGQAMDQSYKYAENTTIAEAGSHVDRFLSGIWETAKNTWQHDLDHQA